MIDRLEGQSEAGRAGEKDVDDSASNGAGSGLDETALAARARAGHWVTFVQAVVADGSGRAHER